MHHTLDVETARGDVGGDENRALASRKVRERRFALLLRAAPVKRRRRHPFFVEQGHDLIRPRLALDEDHRHGQRTAELLSLRLLLQEQLAQPVNLLRVHQLLEVLRDVGRGHRHGADFDLDRLVQVIRRERLDLHGHRRGEQEGLVGCREVHHHLANLRFETHVEHAIRLVEYDQRDSREVGVALVEVIDEAARGGDADLDAVPQVHLLLAHVGSAHHDRRLETLGRSAERLGLLLNLLRELARGRHDDGERTVAALDLGLLEAVLDHGDGERRGLTGTGLRASQNVAACADDRDGLRLDGRGLVVLFELDVHHDLGVEHHVVEGLDRWRRLFGAGGNLHGDVHAPANLLALWMGWDECGSADDFPTRGGFWLEKINLCSTARSWSRAGVGRAGPRLWAWRRVFWDVTG